MAVVAILAERHFPQKEIAKLIDAIGVSHRETVDHVADRLRHFLAAIEQKAMRKNSLRHLDACRHQEGRPIDSVKAHDVLADDMKSGGPVTLESFAPGVGKADYGDVASYGI